MNKSGTLPKYPLVSVIMNCFNGEKYLFDAISSVVNQTYNNWELIFWDNQSTDRSKNIFSQFNDPRLKYFYSSQHTTLGEARNLAISKTNGLWISFLDVDDLWREDKLEKQVYLIDKFEEIGFVYCKSEIISFSNTSKTGYSTNQLPEGDIFNELLKDNFVYYLSALINKDKLLKIPRIPKNLTQVEDYHIFLHMAKLYKVVAVQEICCSYRLHDRNLSRKEPIVGAKESLELVKSFLPDIRAKNALKYRLSALAIAQIKQRQYLKASYSLLCGGLGQFIERLIGYLIKQKKI